MDKYEMILGLNGIVCDRVICSIDFLGINENKTTQQGRRTS